MVSLSVRELFILYFVAAQQHVDFDANTVAMPLAIRKSFQSGKQNFSMYTHCIEPNICLTNERCLRFSYVRKVNDKLTCTLRLHTCTSLDLCMWKEIANLHKTAKLMM